MARQQSASHDEIQTSVARDAWRSTAGNEIYAEPDESREVRAVTCLFYTGTLPRDKSPDRVCPIR